MADITEELRVLVTAEVDKAVKNLNQLDQKTQKTTSDFETLGKAIGAAFLAKEIIDFGKESVRASEDARQKFSLLKTTIDTTGAAAWTSIDAMTQMSKEFSDATNYSVSEIQSMQTVLLGFKNITGDTFREASESIMDMATVMGMDLKSAVQTVGKALDDPINGIDSLKRQGFAFTDSQKSMLKAMVATGNQAGAQKLILDELSTTYGGAAKAAQTSFAKMEHAMDDLKESVGNILTPLLADIAENAVELLEKFNSLDEGTQRVIVTTTGLVALAPAVVTAIGGVKKALMALQAANPVLLGISLSIAGIVAATEALSHGDDFKKLADNINKTKKNSDNLLDSYADGNNAKKLDKETTEKLIKLYPELSGKIDAYSTSVNDAKQAVEALINQKLLDAESSGIKQYLKKLEEVADLELKVSKYKSHNNEMDALRAKEIETRDIPAVQKLAEEQRNSINERIKNLGKMLTYDGKIINIPVEIEADPESFAGSLESNQSSIAKFWHEWLSKILKVDESLFRTGEQAANLYIDGLERALQTEHTLSEILDEKFDMTGFLDSQMSEVASKIKELLNINPAEIDQTFKVEDKTVQKLIDDYNELKKRKKEAYFTDEFNDLSQQITEASMSEKQLYLAQAEANGATEEQIILLSQLYDELELKTADSWTDKLSLSLEDSLEKLELFDAKSNKILAEMATNFANISLDSAMTGFEEFGRALGEGKDAADAMQAALAAMAQQILNQLPMLFLQAGLQLIAQGQWPLGLGLIAAAGSSAIIAGYVDGKQSSAKESAKANALGGVYGADDYSAFAKGGTFTNSIVQSPTFFKFAKGSSFGTGLMGEAGPEAIMPLTRGADGSLGVSASGIGGDYSLTVVINNYGNEEVTASESTAENGQRKLEITIGAMINRHLSDGSADRALKSRYGIRAQGV